MPRTAKPKVKKPGRHQYEVTSESGKKAFLDRVTTVLDWTIKGDGFGAMPYYGAGLLLDFLLPELDSEEHDGVMELWKQSPHSPYATLKAAQGRGQSAHTLQQHLIEGVATLESDAAPWRVRYDSAKWAEFEEKPEKDSPMDFVAAEYDAGACELYFDLFQHFEVGTEVLSEQRVFYTDHPIDECPDEVCTHGYAGTLDSLWPPFLTMGDTKTNKGDARWSAYPQMAFYGKAALQRGLIDAPIEKQIVTIPRPVPNDEGKMYDVFDDKFVDTDIVDPIRILYKYRRAWGPKDSRPRKKKAEVAEDE
jgi:hypothetical protein